MSTSESLKIIAGYALSSSPLLFRIKIESPMDRGASLKWLSVYPGEDEVLYPPLTVWSPAGTRDLSAVGPGPVQGGQAALRLDLMLTHGSSRHPCSILNRC